MSLSNWGVAGIRRCPGLVTNLADVVAIAAGYQFTLAVASNGLAYAWGYNLDGQLGTNSDDVDSSDTPLLIAGMSNVVVVGTLDFALHGLAVTVGSGNEPVLWVGQ